MGDFIRYSGKGRNYFFFIFIFISNYVSSQFYQWADGFDGNTCTISSTIDFDTDNLGNTYLVGSFTGTVDFDPGVGVQNKSALNSNDAFICKLDSNGNFLWVYQFGLSASGYNEVFNGIEVDANGNLIIIGSNNAGNMDFDPSPFTYYTNQMGPFLLKLNSNGGFLWAKTLESVIRPNQVVCDLNSNIILTGTTIGYTGGIIDWDPGTGVQSQSWASGYNDFILKLNSTGNFIWVRCVKAPSNSTYESYGIATTVDTIGNLYTTGYYYGSLSNCQLDPQVNFGYFSLNANTFPLSAALNNQGCTDVFIAKYNSSGTPMWLKGIQGVSEDMPNEIKVNKLGNVIVAGNFKSTIDLIPGTAQNYQTANGNSDFFYVALNNNGGYLWGKTIGGSLGEATQDFDVDNNNVIYIHGAFVGTVDFDPGSGVQNLTASSSSNSISSSFTLKLNSGGSFISVSQNLNGVGKKIKVAGSDRYYIAGSYNDPISFNLGISTTTLTPMGAYHFPIYVAKIGNCELINPSVAVNGLTTFCQGGSVVLTANTGTGLTYQWKNNGTNITGATAASYTATTSGSYSVVVTTSNGCSSTSTATTITVNPLPTATITAGGSITFCQGGSVVLTANTGTGLTYQWKNNGTNITGATAASYPATASGSYSVVVTNSNGCTATSTATTVTVNPLPSATITAGGATTFCQGGSLVLNANTGTGLTYQWKNNGTNITGATAASYTATASGSYSVVVTNSNACSATSTATTVTVNPLPTATITAGGSTTFCLGGSVVMNANTGTGLTYQWKNNGTNITGATAVSFTATSSGSYTVVVTNSNGCSATSTQIPVSSDIISTPTFNQVPEICFGGSLSPLPLISTNGINGDWSPGINNTTTTTYTFTPFPGQCSNSATMTITVNSLPLVSAGNDQTVCQGSSVILTASGANIYNWTNGVSNSNPFAPQTTAIYSVTGTDLQTGCSNTDQVIITVQDLPNVSAGNDQTVCQGTSIALTASGANIYTWSNGINNGVSFIPPIGTNEFTVTGINTLTGCTNIDTVMVTVYSLPIISSGPDQTTCQANQVTLSATGAISYAWNNGVQNDVPFTPISSNTYIVTGTDANGCQNSDTVSVTVLQNSVSQISQSALDSYTLNGQTYTQSGSYTQVIPNAAGCDSTITLNLSLSFTGVNENNAHILTIHPNPVNANFKIDYEGEIRNVALLDMKGALLFETNEGISEIQLPLTLQTGMYTVLVHTDSGVLRKKLLIEQ
jgi:hypothetical protein